MRLKSTIVPALAVLGLVLLALSGYAVVVGLRALKGWGSAPSSAPAAEAAASIGSARPPATVARTVVPELPEAPRAPATLSPGELAAVAAGSAVIAERTASGVTSLRVEAPARNIVVSATARLQLDGGVTVVRDGP